MTHHAVATQPDSTGPTLTVMDHIRELQSRLFAVILTFVVVGAAAYPFFDKITEVLVAPLQGKQELIYLTPGGAFSFIIKVCIYIGIIGSLPVIIYNLYRFIMPAVQQVHLKTVLKYTLSSLVLAMSGIVFAFYVSLPASLYFLTSFNLHDIKAMLTIDSYFSFVMTYLLAGALLFQLPLVMLIIDSVNRLTPRKLMSYQRHMIVGSFVVAAVISPTPDVLNQTLLASPVVVMYQLGILMIWLKNRKSAPQRHRRSMPKTTASVEDDSYAGTRDTVGEQRRYLEQVLNDELPRRMAPSQQGMTAASAPAARPIPVHVTGRSFGEIVAGKHASPSPPRPQSATAPASAPAVSYQQASPRLLPQHQPRIDSMMASHVPHSKPSHASIPPYRVMQRTYATPSSRPAGGFRRTSVSAFRVPDREVSGLSTRRVPSRQISM